MIVFTPIHKRIQKTLYQKIDMLQKNTNLYSIGSNITKKDSDGKFSGIPNENYMMARTTWTRATSFVPVDGDKPIILMGGELDSLGNMPGLFDTTIQDFFGVTNYDWDSDRGAKYVGLPGSNHQMPLRPLPGIKDISIEYRGGGMTLGATRTAEINWTCWTWEELDRLQQHFLAHGKTVFLEWGWAGVNNKLMLSNPYPLFEKNDDGFLIFNMNSIKADENGRTLSDKVPEYILKQNGHYDAMLGVIQNFTWTVRDDGGFDCVTTLVSPGMNALQKQFKSSGEDNIATLPVLVEEISSGWDKTGANTFGSLAIGINVNSINETFGESPSMAKKEKDKNENFKSQIMVTDVSRDFAKGGDRGSMVNAIPSEYFRRVSPYINFRSYMIDLPLQLYHNFVNNKNTRETGSIIRVQGFNQTLDDKDRLVRVGGYNPGTGLSKAQKSEMYCTWGWFEDNVLSRFFGHITIDGKVQGIFRSLDYKYDEDTGEVVKELKNKEGEVIGAPYPQSVKIRSTKKLYTVDTSKWLLIKDDALSGKIKANVKYKLKDIEGEVSPLAWKFSPKDSDDEDAKKHGVCTDDEGFIRNIYFHGMYLAEKMGEASTMEEAIMSVWNEFASAYGGVHQFKIEFEDDGNHIVIRDTGQQGDAVINLIENGKNNRRNEDTGEPGNMNGLFEFPIWENGSIVKSQNLNAKLPNRMQMAAMYGSQNADTSENESQRNNDVLAGEAWGKLFSPSPVDEDEQTLAAMKRKRYRDLVGGDVDYPSKLNRSFGRADANPIKNLHVGKGDGNLEAPVDGTVVYPSIFNEIFAGQAIELQKRMRDKLEGSEEDIEDNRGFLTRLFDPGGALIEKTRLIALAKNKWTLATGVDNFIDMYEFINLGETGYYPKGGGPEVNVDFSTPSRFGKLKIRGEYSAVMKSFFRGDIEGLANKTDPIIPVELEMDVDGTGGIFPGNAFQSSYLPERYRQITCFQVVGASHKVDSTGWTTTIKGQLRVGLRKKNPIDVVLTIGAQEVKEGDEKHNKTVDELERKRDIPKSKNNEGLDIISGEENYQIIKKVLPGLTEKVEERTPEEYEEMARQKKTIDYQGGVNQYEVKKDALIDLIHGEDSQWDEGNLRAIANLIDGREESFGTQNTGLGFLQYMSDNHKDRDKFPQYWTWGDAAEIELAYTNWRDAGGNSTPTGN